MNRDKRQEITESVNRMIRLSHEIFGSQYPVDFLIQNEGGKEIEVSKEEFINWTLEAGNNPRKSGGKGTIRVRTWMTAQPEKSVVPVVKNEEQKQLLLEGAKKLKEVSGNQEIELANIQKRSTPLSSNNNNNNNEKPFPILPVIGAIGIIALSGLIAYKLSRKRIRR